MRIFQTWRERRRLVEDERAARDARAGLVMDYRFVFRGEAGQRVLADILRRAGVMTDPFRPDERETAYQLGMRRLGMEIVEMINSDPDAHLALLTVGDTEEILRNV
jgi:hypothetical protein